jgi:hypothetical protein
MPLEEKVTDCNSNFLAVTAGFLKVKYLLPQRDISWKYCQPQHNSATYSNKFGLFTSIIKERQFYYQGWL